MRPLFSVGLVLLVLGETTGFAQHDGAKPGAPPAKPRLFSLPDPTSDIFASGAPDDKGWHQMQYQEVRQQLLRFYHRQESLNALALEPEPGALDTEEKRDAAIAKLVGSLKDRWTVYHSPKDMEDERWHFVNGFASFGLIVDRKEDGSFVVAYVSGGTPAYVAGLRRNDRILTIDGTEVTGLSEQEMKYYLYGPVGDWKVKYLAPGAKLEEGKEVTLSVRPAGNGIVRAGNVDGYWHFHVKHFQSEQVLTEFAAAVERLNRGPPPKGIILDLRGNRGGLMEVAYQFVSAFFKEGRVGYHLTRSGRLLYRNSLEAQPFSPAHGEEYERLVATLQTAPLVVLVDGSTISAGEMVTSAIKGTRRGTVLGTTTWGKGVSFNTIGLTTGGQLQVVTGVFLGPNGEDHRDVGIEPDVVVERPRVSKEDVQLKQAIAYLNGKNTGATNQAQGNGAEIVATVTLLGLPLAMVLLVVLVVVARTRHDRRRNPYHDALGEQFAEWMAGRETPQVVGAEEIALGHDHFMVGAICCGCRRRFVQGETIFEVMTTTGSYFACKDCLPEESQNDASGYGPGKTDQV